MRLATEEIDSKLISKRLFILGLLFIAQIVATLSSLSIQQALSPH